MSITPGPKAWRTRDLAELRHQADSHQVRTVRGLALASIVGTWLETPFTGGRHARRIPRLDG